MFKFNDGGRMAAGFKGQAHDCVTRAIAIATGTPYQKVYVDLNVICIDMGFKSPKAATLRMTGVPRKAYEPYLKNMGWEFVATMKIGSGCMVHLKADELPSGVIICRVSKHLVTVIDGVIHDTHNPSRGGSRCVYGYYKQREE